MNVQKTKIGSSKTNFDTEIVTEVSIGCLTQGQEIKVQKWAKSDGIVKWTWLHHELIDHSVRPCLKYKLNFKQKLEYNK